MYNFHYEEVKARYGDRATLQFTDTDSLSYHIETEDWYDDIREDVPTKYDTSNYPEDHPAGLPRMNKKVIGMMKDELKGRTMIKFCVNRAKSYSYVVGEYAGTSGKSFCKKKCKGIKEGVIKKHLTFEDFEACVLHKVFKTVEQTSFRSHKHEMHTEQARKSALSPYDDKRVVLSDGVRILPIGHWRTKHPAL